MGMSASQARLLSITGRLTNNEFRAQILTNDKLRLANKTTEATRVYNEALDSEQLMYMNYDDNGNATKLSLTPALMYEYAPMKNQYTLLNTGGKILIPALEAKNYEETNNLGEFLDRYGLVDDIQEQTVTKYERNPEYDKWKAEEPDKTSEIYWEEVPGAGSSNLYDSFLWSTAICYAAAMYNLSENLGLPGETLYDSNGNTVLEYDTSAGKGKQIKIYSDDGSGNVILENDFGARECYSHVLDHLIEEGSYTTSTGAQLITYGTHWWGSGTWNDRGGRAAELANDIATNNYMCCAEDPADITSSSNDIEKLMSDYYIDENGKIQTKSLVQKIVDLDYLNSLSEVTDQQLYDAIKHFVDHDLNVLKEPEKKFKEQEYEKDYEDWKSKEVPEKFEYTETNVLAVINDKEKAQWYTNLWYKMNGSESANLVQYKTRATDENNWENYFFVNGAPKNEYGGEYEVFDKNLFEDANWLQFALEHGVISMEQATFEKPDEDSARLLELSSKAIYWKPIIHTSASDIVSVPDDDAVTRAQVEYKKALKQIKAEDKKLDTDLKKLDTEHSALQAEYDAIKETISKNVQRSFKMFS